MQTFILLSVVLLIFKPVSIETICRKTALWHIVAGVVLVLPLSFFVFFGTFFVFFRLFSSFLAL